MIGKNVKPIDIVAPREERIVLADLLVRMMKFNPDERPYVEKVYWSILGPSNCNEEYT